MLVGFAIGILGHLTKTRWLIASGVILIFLGALLFPLAANLTTEQPSAADRRTARRLRLRWGTRGLRSASWDASTQVDLSPVPRPQGGGARAAARLDAAGAAAPDPRRPDRRAGAGAAALRRLRGLGRLRQGRRDQTAGRAAGPAPRPRRPVRRAERRREAPPLPRAASGRRCRAGAGWRSSTAPGTGGCWSSGSRGLASRRAVAARLRRDQRASSAPSPTRARSWSSSGSTSPPEEQLRRFEAAPPTRSRPGS